MIQRMGSTVVFKLCALSFFGPLATFSDRPSPTGAVEVQTPYHTEQEWIVSSVCRNAFELLAYDKDKKGEAVTPGQVTIKELPGDPFTYDVTVRGARVTAEAKLSLRRRHGELHPLISDGGAAIFYRRLDSLLQF